MIAFSDDTRLSVYSVGPEIQQVLYISCQLTVSCGDNTNINIIKPNIHNDIYRSQLTTDDKTFTSVKK